MDLTHQPKGLAPLFFTELWERFGFYTVQSILMLYLVKGLGYPDHQAYLIFGAFGSLLYLTPVLGGYIADKWLGFKLSILIGGVLFFIGYLLMSVPQQEVLFLGMAIVILGNGFFKANVSSMVGDLYLPDDPRRESGYTLFYMGINLGALLPPVFTGPLVNHYGWNWGFLVAAIGILIGLATFFSRWKDFTLQGRMPENSPFRDNRKRALAFIYLGFGIVLSVALFLYFFKMAALAEEMLGVGALFIMAIVIYFLRKEPLVQRRKLWAALILICISVGFWAIYYQTYTSIMLFADRNMSKEFLGMTIDPEFVQFFNPFYIILLSPVLSWFWPWLEKRGKNPSIPKKFAMGVFFMSTGFLILGGSLNYFSQDGFGSIWWLVLSLFLLTLGELLLSPIGLSMITLLSPRHLVGMMMGVWFLTISVGFAIGGLLSTWAVVPKDLNQIGSLQIYSDAFVSYGALSLLLAFIAFLLIPSTTKLMKD